MRPQCRSLCPARAVVGRQPVAAGQHALSGQHLAGSPHLDVVFMGLVCAAALATYQGLLSWIGLLASLLQTRAAFCPDDRLLRRWILLGTLCWLGNNLLVGSPVAVLMEGLFLISNLVGYYRHYGFDYWGVAATVAAERGVCRLPVGRAPDLPLRAACGQRSRAPVSHTPASRHRVGSRHSVPPLFPRHCRLPRSVPSRHRSGDPAT